MGERRIAVVGAGWAGLAAAVEAASAGADVTLFEMASQAGGRARDVAMHEEPLEGAVAARWLDNGQHICIGAYSETLRLLHTVGIAEGDAFVRQPLTLVDASGLGLRLGRGAPLAAFALAVLRRRGWRWADRIELLRTAARWSRQQFRCDPAITVATLCATLPAAVRSDFVEPLCVAALNTPAVAASASVFLRVLHDALASGPGSADLLLPRIGLGALFPTPALRWLACHGATLRLNRRVDQLEASRDGWRVDGERFDGVALAASAAEAARLVAPQEPAWASRARALVYEPIATVYATSEGCRLPEAMLMLAADADRPAQFVFDRGRLGGPPGLLAFVVSGASAWLERGNAAIERAVVAQAGEALHARLGGPLSVLRTIVEKRATFACTPGLDRPPMAVAPDLVAAGDYVEGPYPATLEGAMRSGVAAARALVA